MARRKTRHSVVSERFETVKRERSPDQFDRTLRTKKREQKKAEFIPRNDDQRDLLADLQNPEIKILFVTGPAGTGKTYGASIWAAEQLQKGLVEKVILTRPAVSTDEEHGYLPGDIHEKMAPWIRPFIDALRSVYDMHEIERMFREDILEIAPLAYMRGRSLSNCILIADECSNTTVSQMKMLLTRIGADAKFIVTGDLEQHDRTYEENGLRYIIEKLEDSDSSVLSHVHMTIVERSVACAEILRLIGE